MPARTTSVADALPKIFDQVQTTAANHQKNVVALHKVHVEVAALTESIHGGRSIKLTDERLFEDTFIELLCRAIVLKKGVSQADRVHISSISTSKVRTYFVSLVTRVTIPGLAKETKKEDDADDDDDTTSARFIARLLKFLLKGFVAKDKIVRYRCVHILTAMVAHLGEIDEDVYLMLRTALIERIHDRETLIRVQAAVALSKLCGSEDPSDVEADESTAIDVLLDTLSHDPAAEVRRAALLNIPLANHTLPALLARSRDTDTVMRRLVYSAILEKNCMTQDGAAMGPLHPRVLTVAQRELIIRNGLGDREPAIRAVAGSLLGAWVDVVRGSTKVEDGGRVMDDVLALLELFDLSENTVAEDALLSIFATRVDIFDQLEFKDEFWTTLTPERAFLARVCVEHCIATDDQTKLETSLPVVTHLAYQIQNIYNKYQEDLDTITQERAMRGLDANECSDRDADERFDDLLLDAVYIIAEMLKLAVNLDYADEIGRRKMFQLVRDMIGQENLPEGLVARCLDVLRVLSPSERDLIRVVVEVVHELRDEGDGEDGEKDWGTGSDGEGEDDNEDDASPSTSTVRARTIFVIKPLDRKSSTVTTVTADTGVDALELHVNSAAFDKECAVYSREIAKRSPSNDSDPGFSANHSNLWEMDTSPGVESLVDSTPYDVSKLEAHLYYFGIRGPRRWGPKLIFRTSKDVFTAPSGPGQDPRCIRLLPVYEHQRLTKDNLWATIRSKIVTLLDQRNIQQSSVDLVRFSWVEENEDIKDEDIEVAPYGTVITTPVTIWVGVLPDTLTGEVAFHSSDDILNLLKEHSIFDVDIAYRESVVRGFSSPELFAPVSDLDPLKAVIDPVTTALGLPIAGLKTLKNQGTMGFFFRADKALYAVTARHVLFPDDEGNNLYSYVAGPKKEVVLMGDNAFTNFLKSIQGHIGTLNTTVDILEKRVTVLTARSKDGGFGAEQATGQLAKTQCELSETRTAIKELKKFFVQMKKQWSRPEDRVIGYVVWAPPVSFSTDPHGYTKDVCVIRLDKKKFSRNFKGNVLDLGPEIDAVKFIGLMYPHIDVPSDFDYPVERLLRLRGILTAKEIRTPNNKDCDGESMRYVIKCGLTTLTTIGRLTGFESHVRRYFTLGSQDSVEVAVYRYGNESGPFSRGGDSGSVIVDALGKFVALLTSGAGPTDSTDITFGSPIHWLWEIIKAQFPGADLYFEDNDT